MDDADAGKGTPREMPEHRPPPPYDTAREDYVGISAGALSSLDDLRVARDFAEMIVDTVREGLLVLDFELRVEAANESFYRAFAVRPEETVGRKVYDLGNGQWMIPELRELLEGILPHERVVNDFEVEHDFERVGRRVMLLNARRLDHHEMILLAIEDVTERRERERSLRESEERYHSLFEAIDEGFCIIEVLFDGSGEPVDLRFIEANPAFERHTGLSDVVGRASREIVPDLEHHWFETFGHIAVTGEPIRFEQESEAMGRWFDVYAFRVGGPESRKVALLFTDVTERRGAEEARRESEARYRTLFAQAPAFIAVLRGPEHRFEYVNAAYLRLVGERDLLGKTGREALPEVVGQGRFELLDRVYESGEPYSVVERPISLQRARGGAEERRYVDMIYQPLREPDGSVGGVLVFGIDATERVEARQERDRAHRELEDAHRGLEQAHKELEQANRELERRVEARTRQVRELSRALTMAEQEERQRLALVLHDDLQQVLVGARMVNALGDRDRLEALLDEALALTRTLSHGLSPPLLYGADITALLRWVAEQARERHGLEVEVEVGDHASVLEPDLRVLLYQIVRELLFNVVKHAGTERARVVAERVGGDVRVVVDDEGVGFDPAVLEEEGGIGLGLSSVRERMELVGGRFEVVSMPGRGTRVSVTVPVRPA